MNKACWQWHYREARQSLKAVADPTYRYPITLPPFVLDSRLWEAACRIAWEQIREKL